ncbi:MAG: chitobiase/beta-hexosaminidase C-terminal domain-containing protein [Prevotellaceae bacterium]|nr:chitobiase/beta-hexosaminidase C-terminal domain-containing protein [Prevotellaceae bacterium]
MAKRLYILLALVCCLTCVHAADTPKAVAYQYWIDSNFDGKVTENLVGDNRNVTIPEEYFSGLSNGVHTLYVRAKDENGKWGRLSARSFYLYDYAVKDDSTTTVLKAYRYAIDDGVVRTQSITPAASIDETFQVNLPSLQNQPIEYGNCSYYFDNPEEGKVTMTRSVYFDLMMQYQNEGGVWSDLKSDQFSARHSVTKDVKEITVGGAVGIPVKPIGGTFEVVKFEIPTNDDYSIRASEGCEMTIKTGSSSTHTYNVKPSQMVESYRSYFAAGTYYAIIYNSLKNMANPSEGLELSLQSICKKPVITKATDGSYKITITTETEGANIYYTTDGTNPTEKSTFYTGEFVAPHNGKIKAIAVKSGYGISYIDSITVTGMQAATPVAEFNHPKLTLTCSTPNSTIYYSIGGTYSDDYRKYTEPVTLEDNSTVYFYAQAPNFNNSEMKYYTPATFVCKTPEFEYNGKYLKIKSSDNSTIYYDQTTKDEKPTYLYYSISSGDSIEISDTLTVWACARHNKLETSDTVKYVIPAVFSGNGVFTKVRTPGSLPIALKWAEDQKYKVKSLQIHGKLNHTDIAKIKEQANLEQLDLSNATIEEATLPDDAFAGLNELLYFVSPTNLTSVGARLFNGCNSLGGIDWRSSCDVPTDILGGQEYANLILFVDTETQASKTICKNIVVGGTIDNITLVDADERAGFYAPRSFDVTGTMSYTRNFTQPTLLTGECQGWEAICLPFYPTSFTHATQGACTPFANWSESSSTKPFWLCNFYSTGFSQIWYMEACSPKIISMPNNDQYADEYILGGDMTFSRSGTIDATNLYTVENNGYRFVSNFTNKPADESRSVINAYEEYNGYKMGSVFVPGLRGAKAFEPYFEDATVEAGYAASRAPMVGVDNSSTGIEQIPVRLTDNDVYSENGIIYINSNCPRTVKIYTAAGQLVRKVELNAGVNQVTGLAKGVYIVNRVKIINR